MKGSCFKHFAKATLAQGAQIQIQILITPLSVSAMRLEHRLGYETEGRVGVQTPPSANFFGLVWDLVNAALNLQIP